MILALLLHLVAERISVRLWIGTYSHKVHIYVRTYVVSHIQECHKECHYIPQV